jgi:hypothetical protein
MLAKADVLNPGVLVTNRGACLNPNQKDRVLTPRQDCFCIFSLPINPYALTALYSGHKLTFFFNMR